MTIVSTLPEGLVVQALNAIEGAPPEQQDALRLQLLFGRDAIPSGRAWVEEFVRIEHKTTGELIPFVYNSVQRRIKAWRIRCSRAKKPARAFILKSRHHGVSTFFLAESLEDTLRNQSSAMFRAGIVAQADDTARELLENAKGMRDNLGEDDASGARRPWKLPVRFDNRSQLRFDQPLNGKIDILSAQSKTSISGGVGRGKHYRFLHMTEVAFWPDPAKSFVALSQTVPMDPGTLQTVESTANGDGGWFYDFFWMCWRKETNYDAMFFPWMDDPDLVRFVDAEEQAHIRETFDDEEKSLIARFDVTIGQLAWRRWAIANLCGGDLNMFHQEYPSTPEEAFLASGRPVFLASLTLKARENTRGPIWQGDVIVIGEATGGVRYELRENPSGFLKIWKHPEDGMVCVVGGDASEGIGQDYCSAEVLDAHSREQLAEYACNTIKPNQFGDVMMALAQHFNRAWLFPETNPPGAQTLQQVIDAGYSKVLFRERHGRAGQPIELAYGWRTTNPSKTLMVREIANDLAKPGDRIASDVLAHQVAAYQVVGEGAVQQYSAPTGGHDDCLMAYGIGLMGCRLVFEQGLEDEQTEPVAPKSEAERHWERFEEELGETLDEDGWDD